MLTVIALNPNHRLIKTHKISIKTLATRRKFTQKLSKMKTSFNQKPPTIQKKKPNFNPITLTIWPKTHQKENWERKTWNSGRCDEKTEPDLMQEGNQKEGFELSQSILQRKTRNFEDMKRSVEVWGFWAIRMSIESETKGEIENLEFSCRLGIELMEEREGERGRERTSERELWIGWNNAVKLKLPFHFPVVVWVFLRSRPVACTAGAR